MQVLPRTMKVERRKCAVGVGVLLFFVRLFLAVPIITQIGQISGRLLGLFLTASAVFVFRTISN